LNQQPEQLTAGTGNHPLRFSDALTTSFAINRQCTPLDGFFF
jgi:hypothetical protein